jgi:hypothetical protein
MSRAEFEIELAITLGPIRATELNCCGSATLHGSIFFDPILESQRVFGYP